MAQTVCPLLSQTNLLTLNCRRLNLCCTPPVCSLFSVWYTKRKHSPERSVLLLLHFPHHPGSLLYPGQCCRATHLGVQQHPERVPGFVIVGDQQISCSLSILLHNLVQPRRHYECSIRHNKLLP